MKNLLCSLVILLWIASCSSSNTELQSFEEMVNMSYKIEQVAALEVEEDETVKSARDKSRRRRARLSEVPPPTNPATPDLPDWITGNQYVTKNVNAIKYKPAVLIGSIVRMFADSTFEVYTAYNLRQGEVIPELELVDKPINFYEKTFSSGSNLSASFIVGGLSVEQDEALNITYTETSYLVAEATDELKRTTYQDKILEINPNAKKSDWAWVRGVTTVDASYSKFRNSGGSVTVNTSFVSVAGELYTKEGETNNFRLLTIDLEPLWFNADDVLQ